jgi:hypothetical protein
MEKAQYHVFLRPLPLQKPMLESGDVCPRPLPSRIFPKQQKINAMSFSYPLSPTTKNVSHELMVFCRSFRKSQTTHQEKKRW